MEATAEAVPAMDRGVTLDPPPTILQGGAKASGLSGLPWPARPLVAVVSHPAAVPTTLLIANFNPRTSIKFQVLQWCQLHRGAPLPLPTCTNLMPSQTFTDTLGSLNPTAIWGKNFLAVSMTILHAVSEAL